jgi:signal transduction histidine kinase
MRSITLKLILSFVAVSLASILLLVLSARYSTGREFRQFTTFSDRSSLMSALEEYYRTQGSWDGVDGAELFGRVPTAPPQERHDPLTVTDQDGKVIRAGSGHQLGDLIPANELEQGVPIQVDGKLVGYLIFAPPPFSADSPEGNFLNRITQLLIYSALAAMAVSLSLGVLISRNLTRPIRELTAATGAIAKGDLSRQVPIRSRDEMGNLAESFNKMSAELAGSLHLRRQMTADIAHELRTPLSLILGHAEAVHDGVLPPSTENFEIVREEALRLDRLVDDLRTLSLADAGELSFAPQPVSPQRMLQEVAASYQYRVGQKDIALDLRIEAGLPEVRLDPGRMTQVLTNILDNALRHSPEGSRIILSAREAGGGVKISIEDDGPGVSPEVLARIFDRFYRPDASRTREDGGSGLGLAIAKSIVEMHHGRIEASPASGQGLIVSIFLPVVSSKLN